MKISKRQLKRIIKEEKEKIQLQEMNKFGQYGRLQSKGDPVVDIIISILVNRYEFPYEEADPMAEEIALALKNQRLVVGAVGYRG